MTVGSAALSGGRAIARSLYRSRLRFGALRQPRPLAVVLATALVGALIGALPIGGSSDGNLAADGEDLSAGATLPAAPDLAPFLGNRRWGVSVLEERRRRQAEEAAAQQADAPGLDAAAALQAIGFVGVAVNAAERAVLLTLPEGEVIRRMPGEALADGRLLVDVRDDALVLEHENGDREMLMLFPIPEQPVAAGGKVRPAAGAAGGKVRPAAGAAGGKVRPAAGGGGREG